MNQIIGTPSESEGLCKRLIGASIKDIFRFGYFSDESLGAILKDEGKEAVFRSLGASVCLHLEDGMMLEITEKGADNSIGIGVIDEVWLSSKLNEKVGEGRKFKIIKYSDRDYGDLKFDKYFHKKVMGLAIIKQNITHPKYLYSRNEVGILLRFEGLSSGLAVGAGLAPKGGHSWVMLISEDEVDEKWMGGYDIIWLS